MEEIRKAEREHKISVANRHNAVLEGISETVFMDDREVVVITPIGKLTVEGENLKVSEFSEGSGKMILEGKISAMVYSGDTEGKRSIFGRKKVDR